MIKSFFKKIPQASYTIGSLAALAAINYSLIQNSMVFIFILVLLVHELGHYYAARKNKANVSLPYFLPLPFIAVGITKVKGLTLKGKKEVALFGPLVGSLTVFLLIILNSIFKYTSYFPLLILFFGEIVFNYFGSDGKQYRKVNRSLHLCTC